MRLFFHNSVNGLLSVMLAFAAIPLISLAIVFTRAGDPNAVYFFLLLGLEVGYLLFVFLLGRLMYSRYAIFGVNKDTARVIIADWGTKRWLTRDPRLTKEFIQLQGLDFKDSDLLERRLEELRPLFKQDWLAVALVVAREAKHMVDKTGVLASIDAVERAAQDTRDIPLLAQYIIALGVDSGCEAYRADIPADYVHVLYNYAAHSDQRIDLSRYDMNRAPVGWKWSHP